MYCGNLVLGPDHQQHVTQVASPAELQLAQSHRDKLLDYDRNSTKRTQVYGGRERVFHVIFL